MKNYKVLSGTISGNCTLFESPIFEYESDAIPLPKLYEMVDAMNAMVLEEPPCDEFDGNLSVLEEPPCDEFDGNLSVLVDADTNKVIKIFEADFIEELLIGHWRSPSAVEWHANKKR